MADKVLTTRQLQILSLVCYTNQQIARRLGVSQATVRNTFSDIYCALGVDTGSHVGRRIRALTTALRNNLLEIGDVSDGDRAVFVRGRGRVFDDGRGKYQRNLAITRLRQAAPVCSIANDFEISRQRVYQICKRIEGIDNECWKCLDAT